MQAFELGVDYGTSHTVAMLRWPDGRIRPLLFDGSPVLPSAVYADPDGRLLVGADAVRAARFEPARFEPGPKRHIDEGELLLGERSVALTDIVGATLRLVLAEAERAAGGRPDRAILTHPAGWGPRRRAVLAAAASGAGMVPFQFVPEPVAAATYFANTIDGGRHSKDIVVYDLGGGTCDVSVLRSADGVLQVLSSDGMDVGGLDLDWLVLDQIAAALRVGPAAEWIRLVAPVTAEDRRLSMLMREDARAAKETLSRQPSAGVHVPLLDRDVHVTREVFEAAARGALAPTAQLTVEVIRRAGVHPQHIAALYLVGGSSRVPAVATVLHRATGLAPTVIEHPELVVAEGALAVPPTPPEPAPATAGSVAAGPALAESLQTEPGRAGPVDAAAVMAARAAIPLRWPSEPAEPSGSDEPGAARRFLPAFGALAGLALALLLILVIVTNDGDGGDPSTGSSSPSTVEPSLPAPTPRSPVYVVPLPDPCALGAALPAKIATVRSVPSGNRSDTSTCHWQRLTSTSAVDLTVDLSLDTIGADTPADAHGAFMGLRSTIDAQQASDAELLPGLGDEAFQLPCDATVQDSGTPTTPKRYEVAGACLVVRSGNAILRIEWKAADYPPGAATRTPLRGTPLDWGVALDEVLAVARAILPQLTPG